MSTTDQDAEGLRRVQALLSGLESLGYRLPAVYAFPFFVRAGGLISFGPDPIDQFARAAGYVDRILRGENPSGLPVQQPTKFELVVNLRAAKALGLTVPPAVLASANG